MGYMETSNHGSLYWFGLALLDKDFKIYLKKKCYYNRYPAMEYLARKKVFSDITNRMRRTFPKQFNFAPISFLVPEHCEELETYMSAHPNFFWIGKPSCGRGGEGIMLLQKYNDIPKNLLTNQEKDLLVQRYVKNPLLIEGKKFDLRLYVLVKGYDPIEAYIANEGLARLCTEKYRQPTKENMKNMFMHLTNFSLNKNSENFIAPTENFLEDDIGSKRLMTSLWKGLEEQGYDVAKVKEKIMEIANGPGEKIYTGELAKGLKILAEGGKIDYDGASAIRFVEPGESAGSYRVLEVRNGKLETVGFR